MDPLHQIIHSLTATEKRYFKMFATAFKSDSEPVILFNALNDSERYDEKDISRKTGIKNLNKTKSLLRQLLFKAMRNYQQEGDAAQQMRDALADIQFLISKRFFEEARKEIHKSWKLAEKNSAFQYMPELIVKLSSVNNHTLKYDKLIPDFESLYNKLDSELHLFQGMYRAHLYNHHVGTLIKQRYDDEKEKMAGIAMQNAIEQMQLQLQNQPAQMVKAMLLITLGSAYQGTGQNKEILETYNSLSTFFAAAPEFRDANVNLYFVYLINYGTLLADDDAHRDTGIRLIDETETAFERYDDFCRQFPDKYAYFHVRHLTNRLTYCKANYKWDMLPGLEADVEKHLEGDVEKVVAALQVAALCACFFLQGNYDKALKWVNIYYTLDDAKTLMPLMICVRMLEVLAYHYDRQFDMSHTKAMNLYRTLVDQKITDEYSKHLFVLLRKLNLWNKDSKSDKAEIEKLVAAFTRLKNNGDAHYNMYLKYFNVLDVLQSIDKRVAVE